MKPVVTAHKNLDVWIVFIDGIPLKKEGKLAEFDSEDAAIMAGSEVPCDCMDCSIAGENTH